MLKNNFCILRLVAILLFSLETLTGNAQNTGDLHFNNQTGISAIMPAFIFVFLALLLLYFLFKIYTPECLNLSYRILQHFFR